MRICPEEGEILSGQHQTFLHIGSSSDIGCEGEDLDYAREGIPSGKEL